MGEGDRRAKIESVFNEAASIDASGRAALLRDRCAGDSDLRAEVESMLARHDALTAEFLESPAGGGEIGEVLSAAHAGERATIGPYTILDTLGEGGFGVVYLAEQSEPVRRRVALKVIKPGMDSKAVLARFEAERQALALMDHPNIAKVFDAGRSEEGRPYFVMERVKGTPITEFCDLHKVGIRDRINIFIDVCDAIQHAHQKGLIHRDIKPSNILVEYDDTKITPMVIDFGVAKALNQKLTEKTIFTEQGQLIGTPEYMSPEQAEMSAMDVDTRADIYSLGVLLYELLSGRLPFEPEELRSAGYAEIQRIIREVDPPKPSTRLSTMLGKKEESEVVSAIVGARASSISDLPRRLRGDLDWIVMKCLEKSRARRYATANGVAEELKRYLNHEPVLAGPPSVGYRMSKFVRRNRAGVLAASIVLIVLTAGLIGTTYGLFEANAAREAESEQRAIAEQRAEELSQVVAFQDEQLSEIDPRLMGMRLQADLLERARMTYERARYEEAEVSSQLEELELLLGGVDFTGVALESLDENIFNRAIEAVETQFGDQLDVRAQLLQAIATTMRKLGLLEQAIAPQEEALAIWRDLWGESDERTDLARSNYGILLDELGRYEEAESAARIVLETRTATLGETAPDTLQAMSNLAMLLLRMGEYDEAETLASHVLETRRDSLGNDHDDTLEAMNNRAAILHRLAEYEDALAMFQEALTISRRIHGNEHPDTLTYLHNVGRQLTTLKQPEEAEEYLAEALELRRKVFGNEHPSTLSSIDAMGQVLFDLRRLDESMVYYTESLETGRRVFGSAHPRTLNSVDMMGVLLGTMGDEQRALPYFTESYEGRLRVLGADHHETLTSLHNLGYIKFNLGHHDEAMDDMFAALEGRRRALGEDHPRLLWSLGTIAPALLQLERFDEFEPHARELVRLYRLNRGDDDPGTLESIAFLAHFLVENKRFAEAEPMLIEVVETRQRLLGDEHDATRGAAQRVVGMYNLWHVASPEDGYDVKAQEWAALLEEPVTAPND